jgi:acetyl-CoA synthetase
MSEDQIFAVPKAIADNALVSDAQYQEMYQASLDDPDAFWAEHGQRLDWMRPLYKSQKHPLRQR